MNRAKIIRVSIITTITVVVIAIAAVGVFKIVDSYLISRSKQKTASIDRSVGPVTQTSPTQPVNTETPITNEASSPQTVAQPVVRVLKTANLEGFRDYEVSGIAQALDTDGKITIQLGDDFKFSGAPDPVLYLSSDPNARTINNALNLGQLTSDSGAQAYQITLEEYNTYGNYLIIWCEAYSIYMGGGQLNV